MDIVVDPWQVVGDGTFRCIPCREKRIDNERDKKIGALKESAERAREASGQKHLSLKA